MRNDAARFGLRRRDTRNQHFLNLHGQTVHRHQHVSFWLPVIEDLIREQPTISPTFSPAVAGLVRHGSVFALRGYAGRGWRATFGSLPSLAISARWWRD